MDEAKAALFCAEQAEQVRDGVLPFGRWTQLALCEADKQDEIVGDVAIFPEQDDSRADWVTVECGVTLKADLHGRGFGSLLSRALIPKILSFADAVTCSIDPRNKASMALAAKAGFVLQDVRKNSYLNKRTGEWCDDVRGVLIAEGRKS